MVKKGSPEAPNRVKPSALVLILTLFFTTAFGKTLIDRVVANVNGEPILESEVKIASLFYGVKDEQKLIKILIDKHLIAQFLKNQGLAVPPAYSDSYIKEMANSNGKTVEAFLKELYASGITPSDLKRFIELEMLSTLGLRSFLSSKLDVSDLEIEIERLKKGEVRYAKRIELLVLDRDRAEELLSFKNLNDLKEIADKTGEKLETMKVYRGDLVESLDREVWRAEVGKVVVAEDENNIYLAKVLKVEREHSGRSEEEIRNEILEKKIKEMTMDILKQLRDKSYVEVLIASKSAS